MIERMTSPATIESRALLVLAATPIGRVGGRAAAAGRGARRGRRGRGRGHPAAASGLHRPGRHVAGRVVSYFEGNETAPHPALLEALHAGERVLLVTDAGMPSVSDPGYRLVAAAVAAGVPVTAVPGPSAVLTALAVSGLPVDRFCFEGFLPRKAGRAGPPAGRARRRGAHDGVLRGAAPDRGGAGRDGGGVGADRRAAVCRELTKTHEEVRRGPLAELAAWAADGVRGEVTIVVAGRPPDAAEPARPDDLRAAVADARGRRDEPQGRDRRGGPPAGVPKREVYDAVHRR